MSGNGCCLFVRRGRARSCSPEASCEIRNRTLRPRTGSSAKELRCSVQPGSPVFLGTFSALAANEVGCVVEAALYRVERVGAISAASEIEEITWVDPAQPHHPELAPLTRETVLPLAMGATGR
jgi:8-oxo-dGTP diphosphatase